MNLSLRNKEKKLKLTTLGFTLIELLSILIILGVIALIATPTVLNVIDKSKEKADLNSAYGVLSAGESLFTKSFTDQNLKQKMDGKTNLMSYLALGGGQPLSGTIHIDHSGNISMAVQYGKKCYSKRYREKKIISTPFDAFNCVSELYMSYFDPILNGADPVLRDSMIPIYFDGNVAKKADIKGEWYNYTNKKWANVVLVKDTGTKTRQAYVDAVAGTAINEADVLAYLVWIPRYKYKLFNVEQTANTTPSQIEIVFESRATPKSNGTTNGSYLTAPGFTFGTEESSGIWMGKFETTGDTTTPTIKPNVTSLRSQIVSNLFNANQKFNNNTTYGLTSGTRMARNTDWTVAAYLSHSIYGINEEVRINNNNGYKTGCGASTANAASVSTCDIVYGQASNGIYPQSTTGNITGIFDMSGGAWEYVMGILADSSGNPRSGQTSSANSGYNGLNGDGSTTVGLAFPESKYYDLYTAGNSNSCGGGKCLGHSLGETAGWYGDYQSYVYPSNPWFVRGGNHNSTSGAGVFDFYSSDGIAFSHFASRLTISL